MLNAPQLNRFLEDLIHLQEFIVSNKELEDDVYYKGFFFITSIQSFCSWGLVWKKELALSARKTPNFCKKIAFWNELNNILE